MAQWNRLQNILSRLARRLREQRGQALVEFALVLPILLTIVTGIVYFGRYEDYSNQETQLAGQAVRMAAVDNNPSANPSLQAYVKSLAQPELQTNGSAVTTALRVFIYYPSGSTGAVGTEVRACVLATVAFPLSLGSGTITQVATMRVEQPQTSGEWSPDSTATVPANCPLS
jgi:Flp pilus assembly protein TadG